MKTNVLLVITLLGVLVATLPARPWTEAASGRTIEGDFVRQEGGIIVVRRADGSIVKIPSDRLSDEDREFVNTQATAAQESPQAAAKPKPTHKKGTPIQEGDVLDLSFRPVNGDKVDLAAMKDKVVLLDFWATWCGPCVAELPNVKQAYAEYHAKGFEIIGISLDSEKSTLKDFIKENEMPWPQYFDGKGWENELAQEYGVNSIPAVFLVKNSKVIATDVRGGALQQQLSALT